MRVCSFLHDLEEIFKIKILYDQERRDVPGKKTFRTVPEALRERSFLFFIAQYSYLQTGNMRAILVILGN